MTVVCDLVTHSDFEVEPFSGRAGGGGMVSVEKKNALCIVCNIRVLDYSVYIFNMHIAISALLYQQSCKLSTIYPSLALHCTWLISKYN